MTETRRLVNVENVNERYSDGSNDTLLQRAARKGYYEIVKELLIHHPDIDAENESGCTAIMEASWKGHSEITKELMSDKTDLEKKNQKKKSALQLAKESQKQDIIEMIESFSDRKKVEAAKRELKKLQANEIINKKKREIARVSAVNDEVLELLGSIDKMEKRNKILEKRLKIYREKVTLEKCLLKRKIDSDEFKSYKKLKQEYEFFERCYEEEAFHKVIQPTKRECPICITEMTPEKKIYQCQSGHFFCEECFGKIRETTKSCPVCRVDVASNSIRCRALEDVIKEEAN